MTVHDLVPILTFAVAPVILISGVGLLLLSMTNRFGRVIDRARELTVELRGVEHDHRDSVARQLRILMRRAGIVRASIRLAAVSLLLAAVLVITLFVSAVLRLEIALVIVALFVGCMLSLTVSLVLFIADIDLSLTALKLEVGSVPRRGSGGGREEVR
ncbi:MAG: DUF2721 domain-containing protein [Deltaproteobacteria bacterium]|nr:DUF2721 domain-containing protein [Deltaproteobacteria bacterium]